MKKLMKGVDFLENSDVSVKNQRFVSFGKKIVEGIVWFADLITPLKETVKKIKLQQDKSVSSFFETYRFLIQLSMINLLPFAILLYDHNISQF